MYKCVGGSFWQKEAEPVWSHSSWLSGHTPHLGCVSNISPGHTGVLCFHGGGAGTGNSHRKRTGPKKGEPSGEPKQLES